MLSESLATPFDTVLYITIIVLRVYDAIKTDQGQPPDLHLIVSLTS